MNLFSSKNDSIANAAAAILFNEDISAIKDTVSKLKVGDVTNFGVVKAISDTSISFKQKDTPLTKIAFNQRKVGSKDFVLDKLMKLKEEVELDEASNQIKAIMLPIKRLDVKDTIEFCKQLAFFFKKEEISSGIKEYSDATSALLKLCAELKDHENN